MSIDSGKFTDNVLVSVTRGRTPEDTVGVFGWGEAILRDERGKVKLVVPFKNLITTFGDEYYIRRAAAAIGTPNIAQPTLVNGMKLGTGTTPVAKSGAGSALVTYLSASNALFSTTHPTVASKGGDTGWRVAYRATWAAGVATNAAISEVVIVNDAAANATSVLGNTISRAILSPAVNKAAGDALEIIWNHDFLGA
jgi:hypothetical protein